MKTRASVVASLLALAVLGCQQDGAPQGSNVQPSGKAEQTPTEYAIVVSEEGFEPAETRIPQGRPVTLVITRKTDKTCATEIVFPSLGKRYALPLDQPVRVALGPQKAGTVSYVCGMNMLGGKVIIR
jgi:plastocyanin domain-containing protein